ncbi:MAG: 6-phosphogluconolactonase [Bacteroidales bacterium]|nr:6-phosphogluconolactonase [Bacteroidales bacterium]
MNIDIKIFRSAEESASSLADELAGLINKSGKDRHLAIALSGGSTPKLLFQALAERHQDSVDWRKVNLFWVDERCVPPDDSESNYGMTRDALLEKIALPPGNVHRIRGEEDPDSEAVRYSEVIERSVDRKNDLPFFDVVLLGLGDDGHTASIFPGNAYLFEASETCLVAVNPYSGQKRITITGRIINNAAMVIFLVSGKKKAEIVNKIMCGGEKTEYPAEYVKPVDGRTIWYLDEDAASLTGGQDIDC